jgi:hypothetical protein
MEALNDLTALNVVSVPALRILVEKRRERLLETCES